MSPSSYRPSGIVGVVHLPPLPGDPMHRAGGFDDALAFAARDAEALVEGGCSALIVENFGSAPFPKGDPEQPSSPHAIAALALAVARARTFGRPVGVNVLRNDVRAALGIAAASGADFVRVNVHVGAYVTDQGLIEGRAFETLRYRRLLSAESVAILADVRVKHASPLAELPLEREVADVVKRGRADAVIVTGSGTGEPVDPATLEAVHGAAAGAPVLIGSGLEPASASTLARFADAAIVGTWLKQDGDVARPVDADRVRRLVQAWAEARA